MMWWLPKKLLTIAFNSAFFLACLLSTGGCAKGRRGAANPAAVRRCFLKVLGEPSRLRVYEDDRYVGHAAALAINPAVLEQGKHYLTFSSPGYFPHDLVADLQPGITTIKISLRKIPVRSATTQIKAKQSRAE